MHTANNIYIFKTLYMNDLDENINPGMSEEELRKIINFFKEQLKEVDRLIQKTQNYNNNLENIKSSIEEKNIQFNNYFTESNNFYTAFIDNTNKITWIVSTLEWHKTDILNRIKEMELSYNEFREIKGKIESNNWEISQLVENAKQLKKDIETKRNSAEKILEEIDALLTKVNASINEMQVVYDKFKLIRAQIEDEENGLDAVYNKMTTLEKSSKTLSNDIKKFRDEALANLNQIKEYNINWGQILWSMKDALKEVKDKRDEASNIIDLITDSAFVNSFLHRKVELETSLYKPLGWKWIFIITSISITIFFILMFGNLDTILEKSNALALVAARLSLWAPLYILLWVAISQYSNDRNYIEKYAFKAATATTFRNHTEFLIKKFSITNEHNNKEILAAVCNIISGIYKAPYDEIEDVKENTKKDKFTGVSSMKFFNRSAISFSSLKSTLKQAKSNKDEILELLNDDAIKQIIHTLKWL